jgi:hypothetical protein
MRAVCERGCLPASSQSSNLQAAATHVKRFRGVEKLVPVAEEDRDSMRRAEGELSAIVEARFQHAISSHDVDGVTACCQLMNILGHAEKVWHRVSVVPRLYGTASLWHRVSVAPRLCGTASVYRACGSPLASMLVSTAAAAVSSCALCGAGLG